MLKKLALAAFGSLGAIALAGAAQAAPVSIPLTGTVPVVCEVTGYLPNTTLNLSSPADQTIGSLTYTCNAQGGFDRTISSLNNGTLKNGSQSIAYSAVHGGGSGLNFAATHLTTPINTHLAGSSAFATGQTGAFRVNVPSLPAGLMAGAYTDTVTVSVTAVP